MSEKISYIGFLEAHLKDIYINENFSNNPFSGKHILHHCEFGQALGWAGVKVHAKNWLKFFKTTHIDEIDVLNDGDGIIACEYVETVQQCATFKTIKATIAKPIKVTCMLALGIEDEKITHYCLVKDIPQLTRQLVDDDQEKYNKVVNLPIFSRPYNLHVDIIIEHLKQNNIIITKPQAHYLCGYFMGAKDTETRKSFGMPSSMEHIYEQEILQLLRCSNWTGAREKLFELNLVELLVEGFTLLRAGQSSSCSNTLRYEIPLYLADNSKYIL